MLFKGYEVVAKIKFSEFNIKDMNEDDLFNTIEYIFMDRYIPTYCFEIIKDEVVVCLDKDCKEEEKELNFDLDEFIEEVENTYE